MWDIEVQISNKQGVFYAKDVDNNDINQIHN